MTFDQFKIKSAIARGMVLEICTLYERNLEGVLSNYFCRDENHQRELVELIFGTERLMLSSKQKILIELLKRKCSHDNNEFQKRFKGLEKRLKNFADTRNVFAHDANLIPEEFKGSEAFFEKYSICLISIKDVEKSVYYTEEEIDSIIHEISELEQYLVHTIAPFLLVGHNGQTPSI